MPPTQALENNQTFTGQWQPGDPWKIRVALDLTMEASDHAIILLEITEIEQQIARLQK